MHIPVRYRVGECEIAIISDGYTRLDGGAVFGLVPRMMWEPVIGSENIDSEHKIRLGLNCVLVRRGEGLTLIETGMGAKKGNIARERGFPGDYGYLLQGLAALGVAREEVTTVVNTHLHADHCGWNTMDRDGAVVPTFPNARYFVPRGEYHVATNTNDRTRGTYFSDNFEPLLASGQLELVSTDHEISPGITLIPTPGHTEDHAAVVLSSAGETMIYTGDAVHHAVQIERPAWIPAFDILPLVSLETKKQLAERAIRERALLVFTHAAFPGAGRLTQADGRRTFVPE